MYYNFLALHNYHGFSIWRALLSALVCAKNKTQNIDQTVEAKRNKFAMTSKLYFLLSKESNGDYNESREWRIDHIVKITTDIRTAQQWVKETTSNFNVRNYIEYKGES